MIVLSSVSPVLLVLTQVLGTHFAERALSEAGLGALKHLAATGTNSRLLAEAGVCAGESCKAPQELS